MVWGHSQCSLTTRKTTGRRTEVGRPRPARALPEGADRSVEEPTERQLLARGTRRIKVNDHRNPPPGHDWAPLSQPPFSQSTTITQTAKRPIIFRGGGKRWAGSGALGRAVGVGVTESPPAPGSPSQAPCPDQSGEARPAAEGPPRIGPINLVMVSVRGGARTHRGSACGRTARDRPPEQPSASRGRFWDCSRYPQSVRMQLLHNGQFDPIPSRPARHSGYESAAQHLKSNPSPLPRNQWQGSG